MAESLSVTYDVLRREIGRFLGLNDGRDPSEWTSGSDEVTDVDDVLRSGVRRVLTPPPLPGEKQAHEWSFRKPKAELTTTAPYSTGTVTIVSGVATIADGSWPTWSEQGSLTIATGTYAVDSVDGDELTLSDTSVSAVAGTTFSLGRLAYDLPDDFVMIEGPMIYAAGQSILQSVVTRTSEYQLLQEQHNELQKGYPRRYAIRPKSVDMTASTAYELLLSPSPDGAYTLIYHYRVGIPALDATNTTPPGGDAHGELYMEACLAAAEQKFHDTAGIHTQRFMECLIASVHHDRVASSPDTVGFNSDRSDGLEAFDPDDHFYTQPNVTRYNGVYPP